MYTRTDKFDKITVFLVFCVHNKILYALLSIRMIKNKSFFDLMHLIHKCYGHQLRNKREK